MSEASPVRFLVAKVTKLVWWLLYLGDGRLYYSMFSVFLRVGSITQRFLGWGFVGFGCRYP